LITKAAKYMDGYTSTGVQRGSLKGAIWLYSVLSPQNYFGIQKTGIEVSENSKYTHLAVLTVDPWDARCRDLK